MTATGIGRVKMENRKSFQLVENIMGGALRFKRREQKKTQPNREQKEGQAGKGNQKKDINRNESVRCSMGDYKRT